MSKTYIIGDLHGCFDEFIELSNRIGITENDLVISLGDIVDRGNKSYELYEYFKNRKNAVVLMGNHERKHLRGVLSYSQEIVKVQFADKYDDFIKWVDTLPYYYETNEAIIIHAFFEHDIKLQNQKNEVLSGTTSGSRYLEKKYEEDTYWEEYYSGSKPIIYGHHVVGNKPKIKNNTYGIDTGACHGGYLTIIELPEFKIHQIKVERDYWKEQQSKWQIPVLESKDWENMKIEQVHKQIQKLSYKKETEIVRFLEDLKNWIKELSNTVLVIKDRLESITIKLKERYQEEFNKEVSKLSYSGFIYKVNSNRLHLKDLEKSLDTPQKVIDLALNLNLDEIPKRKASR
ncbi:metallophosphoesterase [Winogradskyella vidalii]|uniref:metallophosphoesterase n=1 Tax=Winogradskyella vidalii TaxID=2615024 RepID=UPI0015CACC44|nr:metallophosphoesterase [Winogradskyella vidalii]